MPSCSRSELCTCLPHVQLAIPGWISQRERCLHHMYMLMDIRGKASAQAHSPCSRHDSTRDSRGSDKLPGPSNRNPSVISDLQARCRI